MSVRGAGEPAFTDPEVTLETDYAETAEPGTVRYVCQTAQDDTFHAEYWGEWAWLAGRECGTACVSMALSWLGVDAEPKDLAAWWVARYGTFATVFRDVPEAAAEENMDFLTAWENYTAGDGLYSPPLLRLSAALNPYRSGNTHYVLVIGRYATGDYAAVNPAEYAPLRLTLAQSGDGYAITVTGSDGAVLRASESAGDMQVVQYHVAALPERSAPLPPVHRLNSRCGEPGVRERTE